MMISTLGFRAFAFGAAIAAGALVLQPLAVTQVHAKGETPTTIVPTKCKKFAEGSTKRKKCVKGASSLLDTEDLWTIGYWMIEAGDYKDAIRVLKKAEASNDKRVLTYLGFATRKLGDVDYAMGYYNRALAVDPNFVVAREYMGEAFLQQGNVSAAVDQLNEIEKRCGAGCEEYAMLKDAIAKHQAS